MLMMLARTMKISDLPSELAEKIFILLNPSDLYSVSSLSRFYYSVVKNSAPLKYQIALEESGCLDNPRSPFGASRKLDILVRHAASWRHIDPSKKRTVAVDGWRSSFLYCLSNGYFIMGETDEDRFARRLRCLDLNSVCAFDASSNNAEVWSVIAAPSEKMFEICAPIAEHDLLVVMTQNTNAQDNLRNIYLNFYQFSTGKPHPLAAKTVILVETAQTLPFASLDIDGSRCLLSLSFSQFHSSDFDSLILSDWKAGHIIAHERRAPGSFNCFVLLSYDRIFVANSKDCRFDIFQIPDQHTSDPPALFDRLASFTYSRVPVSCPYMQCCSRSDANSRSNGLNGQNSKADCNPGPFSVDPEKAVIHVNMIVWKDGHAMSLGCIVHKQSLLEITDRERSAAVYAIENRRRCLASDECERRDSLSDASPVEIGWDVWGAKASRWFDLDGSWGVATAAFGQRMAITWRSKVVIRDFSPYAVARERARTRQVPQPTTTESRKLDSEESAPLDTEHERSSSDDGDSEFWQTIQVVTEGSSVRTREFFDFDAYSTLPYVEYVASLNEYSGVVVDEDRLIGIKLGGDGSVSQLDIYSV